MFNLKNKNHTQADSVRFSLHVLGVASLLMAFSLVFTNCSFLEDDGFFNKVENEVAVANADKMNVYIRHASIKFGKTQPADAALYQIKNNVEFSVTAMINEEYAFYRWAAFSTADFDITKQQMSMIYVNDEAYYSGFGAKELDSSVVKFENPRSETTKVRVMQTRNDIWLLPVVAERPKIKGTYPKTSQTPVRNSKLRVQFSKPMDETSFEGNFIISQGTYAADFSINETDITDKFQVEINESKNLATFSFRDAAEMFAPGVIIKLYFTEDIADSTGYTMQGSSSTRELEWSIGASVDTLPPLIIAMTAGTGNDCSKFSSTSTKEAERANSNIDNSLYDDNGVIFDKFKLNDKNEQIKDAGGDITLKHRVRDKVNIFVYSQDIAKADGERLESDVLMLGFRAKALTDLSGNALDSTQPGNFVADKIETYAGGENYSEISGKSFKAITGSSGGCIYTYDLSSLPDGLIQIQVYAYDATGNDGLSSYDPDLDDADGYGNGPRSLFIIKDTKAPDIATELGKIKSKSAAAPFGWYNKRSIDTIEVYDETANPIQDYGHPKLAAFHDDIKWVFNMGEGTEWNLPSTDPAWVSIKDKYKIGSASVETDGPVSITFRLMDDLGNISEAAGISSVLYDNTIPVSGQALCSDSSGNAVLNATGEARIPNDKYIKVPFTEELAGVKIIAVNVTSPNGSAVSSPYDSETKITYTGESGESSEVSLDTSLDLDAVNKEYKETPVFSENITSLHVLAESYKTGTFYIRGINLGDADGIYTVTVTLYDAALNKAAESQVKVSRDTTSPVVNNVVVKNVVSRTVYGDSASTWWLPRAAYDDAKEAKFVTLEVTATENGSGVKYVTLGENAHLTSETTITVEGSAATPSIDTSSNTLTFSDYNNPPLYKASGSFTFTITGVRLDNPDTAGGNKIKVELTDFVEKTGSNKDGSGFKLFPDNTSASPVYAVYSDSSSPAITADTPAIADGKADSASDETEFSTYRLASSYTDKAKVDLTLALTAEENGCGVNSFTLSNGVFTAASKVYVDTTELAIGDYSFLGATVNFPNFVFTGAETFKFTNVELQSPDGSQNIVVTAKDFTGWTSAEIATNSIVLDTVAPVPGTLDWCVKEGVFGVAKSNTVDNLALLLPYTEATGGVKVIKANVTLEGNSSYNYTKAFSSSSLKVWWVEDKSVVNASWLASTSPLTKNTDYKVSSDSSYITLETPKTSGCFVFLNLKASEDADFVDNDTYTFSMHLTDAALNGSASDSSLALKSDKTAPEIKRIFINRLIARTMEGETSPDSYWISKEDFAASGSVPTKIEVQLTVAEKSSGIETITLGENLRLTSSSEISCAGTALVNGTDYAVSSNYDVITLKDMSNPKLKAADDFIITITNATLNGSGTAINGEKQVSVTLKDFALNGGSGVAASNSNVISVEEDPASTKTVTKVYVDSTLPAVYAVKLADRGGAAALASRPDTTNKTTAQAEFTNEEYVNIAVRTTYSSDSETKRSGITKLVLTGATFSTDSENESKIYVSNLTATSDSDIAQTDAETTGTGYTEITGATFDDTTATLPASYACKNVCMFIITNIKLSESDGSKTVYVKPVDFIGWEGSSKSDSITLDKTAPEWAAKPFVVGASNTSSDIYPHNASDDNIIFDDEIYFYTKEDKNPYLTAQYTELNIYKLYYKYLENTTSDFSDKTSAYVAKNYYSNSNFTNNQFHNGYSFIFVLMDKAGNFSDVTQTVRFVKDGGIEKKYKSGSSEYSLQYKMKYVDDYDSTTEGENGTYKVFETGKTLDVSVSSSNGVAAITSGYPVFYNRHKTSAGRGAKVVINLEGYLERTNTKTASGIAKYAVNSKTTAPEDTASDWTKWTSYDSTQSTITVYPKDTNYDTGALRLWFKDNVGNTGSILVANGAGKTPSSSDLRTETYPDVWLRDGDAPTIDNGFQPTGTGYDYDYQRMTPEGVYYPNGDVYTGSPINVNERSNADKNRMFYTDTALYKTTKSERVVTDSSKSLNSSYYGVRVILYPYAGSGTPSRDSILTYMDSHSSSIKYFGGETAAISSVPFPRDNTLDVLKGDHFIYVVCQDAVGNMKIEKLKYKCGSGNGDPVYYSLFVRDNTPPEVKLAADNTIVLPYSYSSTSEDFSGHGNWTNTQENFQKLCPPNAGYRVWYDSTKGTNGTVYFRSPKGSNPYSYFDADKVLVDSYEGANTSRNADGVNWDINKKRPFFYIDIDKGQSEDNLFAFYYGDSGTHFGIADTKGRIKDIGEPDYFSNWGCGNIIGWSAGFGDRWMNLYKGEITTSIDGISSTNGLRGCTFTGKVTAFVEPKNDFSSPIYLHILDKAGWATTVSMGTPGTIWENDVTSPSVAFNGTDSSVKAGLNDDDGLYRMDAAGSTSLTLTFSGKAETEIASGPIKVYIPKDVASDAGSGIWGYSWTRNIDGIKTDDSGKPYLEFSGSSSALKIGTAKTFYIYDNVGNWTACSLTSSIDSTPPEISMSFGNYDTYTTGAIADKDGHVIQLSGSSTLSGGSYGGTYTTESSETNPFTIYSNARTASSSDGMILGYFTAKDKNGNEETTGTYLGKITQVIVKTHVITTSGTSAGVDVSDIVAPYFTTNTTTNISTLNMPIYLDGSGNSSSDSTIKGTSFLGKLYEITIKDTGGNATSVWLKVLRDREGPAFSSRPSVTPETGKIGKKDLKYYYNNMLIGFTASDSGAGPATYSVLGGSAGSTALQIGATSSVITKPFSNGDAVSFASNSITGLASDKLRIRVSDILGNTTDTTLAFNGTAAGTSDLWVKDTVAPSSITFKEENFKSDGKIVGHVKGNELYFIEYYNMDGGKVSYETSEFEVKVQSVTDPVTSSASGGAIKGYFVTTYDATNPMIPDTLSSTLKITPSVYSATTTKAAKVWAVDYAGNKNSFALYVKADASFPTFTTVDEATAKENGIVKGKNDANWYFKSGAKVIFNVVNTNYNIKEYGVAWKTAETDTYWTFKKTSPDGTDITKNTTKTVEWEIPSDKNNFWNINGYAYGSNDGFGSRNLGYGVYLIRDDNAPVISELKLYSGTLAAEGSLAGIGDSVDATKTYSTNASKYSLSFTITDAGVGYETADISGATYDSTNSVWIAEPDSTGKVTVTLKDKLGNEKIFAFTAAVDNTAPEVTGITLSGDIVKLYGNSADGYKLYYNNKDVCISAVTSDDSYAKYALTTASTPETVPGGITWNSAGSDLKLNDISASGTYLASKDVLGNISVTSLKSIKVKVGSTEYNKVDNYYFDETKPPAPTGVAFSPAASEMNGWYTKDVSITECTLYYNISTITAAPVAGTPAEANHLGFKVGSGTSVSDELSISLSNGDAEIYAVDKAGNVSESAYIVHMIKDDGVPAPAVNETTPINEDSTGKAFWSTTDSKVYYKIGENTVYLNVDFTADSLSGLRGYKTKVGTDEISGLITLSSETTKVALDVTGQTSPFDVKIYAVDNTGNINSDGEALTINFNELTNAKPVTGIGPTVTASPDTGNASKFGDNTIYVDGTATKVTVTPTLTVADVTGIKGFASEVDGTIQEGTTFEITLSDDAATTEGQSCDIYAVNNLGLYSTSAYTVTIKRDNEGPVVKEITLKAPAATETTPAGKINYAGGKLYYNSSSVYINDVTAEDGFGMPAAADRVYAITTAESGTPTIAAGTELKIGELSKASNEVYIATIDALGNVSYTPISKVKITISAASTLTGTDDVEIAGTADTPVEFTFVYDATKPGVPVEINAPSAKVGNGMWKSTDKDATHHMYTMYYNTASLSDGKLNLEVTFPNDTSGIVGYGLVYVTSAGGKTAMTLKSFGTPIASDATGDDLVRTIPVEVDGYQLVKFYAVDGAGNVNEDDDSEGVVDGHVIWLKKDDEAAKTIEQIKDSAGVDGSIFLAYTEGGSIVYYKSGLKLNLKLEANESPITSYALVEWTGTSASETAPANSSTAWKPISVTASEGEKTVSVAFGDITELKTNYALWIRDAVGNTKAYENPSATGKPNGLGDPTGLRGNDKKLKDTWWHVYDKESQGEVSYTMTGQTLKITGFSENFPVKSLKFKDLTFGDDNMKISKVTGWISDTVSKDITSDVTNKDISKTEEVYELSFNKSYVFKDFEIIFDKGAFYFGAGAEVTISSGFGTDSVMSHLDQSLKEAYYYEYDATTTTLTISGMMSGYNLKNIVLSGLTFTGDGDKGVDSVKDGSGTAITANAWVDSTSGNYCIQISSGCAVDSLVIKFKTAPTLGDSLTMKMYRDNAASSEAVTVDLIAPPSGSPSIFGRFFDNVSSGISSIFTGRSMTHEERMALKEAKAAKKAALAAEKAAKKAAKKAARDAKKNAELASAEQGQSWTGLSGEFDSASSELNSAVSKMNSNASQTASQAQISSKKNVLKVKKTGVKSSESASAASAAEMSSKESASGNRLIYILAAFASLAVCGGAATVLVKKMRRR